MVQKFSTLLSDPIEIWRVLFFPCRLDFFQKSFTRAGIEAGTFLKNFDFQVLVDLPLRWENKLDPRISKLPFNNQELEEISKLKSESKSWKEISRLITEKYCQSPQRRTALDCFKAFRNG